MRTTRRQLLAALGIAPFAEAVPFYANADLADGLNCRHLTREDLLAAIDEALPEGAVYMRGDIVCPVCHVNRSEFHKLDCHIGAW